VGALAIVVYVAVGGSGRFYDGFGLAAAAGIVAGIALYRPPAWRGWLCLAAAQAVLWLGDVVYFGTYAGDPPFPSSADALYLVGLLLFGVALCLLVSRRNEPRDLASYADAAVISLAIGLILWATLFSGALGEGAALARVVSVAYPVLDLALLAMLVRGVLTRGARTPSYYLLGASVLALVLADAWYVVPALSQHYVSGTWRDGGWFASYILAGAAALHPSMRTFVLPKRGELAARRVVLLGASLIGIAAAAVVQQIVVGAVNVYAFAALDGVMLAFVTVRVVGLVRALDRTRADAEESERRFRMVLERAPIGISIGRDGIMSETNPALQQMLGYSAEELAGMHYTAVTHPDDHHLVVQDELDLAQRDAFAIDKRYVRKDGTTVQTHVNVALDIEDGLGISLVEDATERHALESQLRQAQKMEAIGNLAGGIAHDFNNLMTAVIGYSDLLLGDLAGHERQAEKVGLIRESAVRASDLTRQLLAFSRRQVLQTVDIDLRDVVERMESLLRMLIGDHITLVTMYGSESVVLRADPTQLEQVVMNLAVNARDAMPGGGTLTIAVVSNGQTGTLSVADEGTGMDADVLARIFEPFYTTKPVGEGSGLGLSTVHGIVGQTGGSTHVESTPGSGTTFLVRLPLAHPGAGGLPGDGAAATFVD
jgi:PAS domain S-box-containing protein